MLPHPLAAQDVESDGRMDREYQSTVRPLFKRYCYDCHMGEFAEGEIDLAAFANAADVGKQVKVWIKVRRMLDGGQMPPKAAIQPTDSERAQLQNWVRSCLAALARAHAGDPGPVVLRRLSNAEYTYTIRDLAGVDSLNPTSEFPVDGAAGEGFSNSGSGQGMSPSLVQKYLDAAKQVAGHAVLLPDGIRFSPYTSRRDQTNAALARIQSFYSRFTDEGGGTAVNLQGIQFDTNRGGRLPIGKYLEATLAERDAILAKRKTLEEVAGERSLNLRYLRALWEALTNEAGERSSFLMSSFRRKWQQATVDDAAALTAEIAAAQKALWKFNSIGHIGREGGPKSWMEAVSPVVTNQELRLPLPDPPPGSDVVLYLIASDLDDGNEHDFVQWQRPRIEFKDDEAGSSRLPVLLRDVRPLTGRIEKFVAAETPRTTEYLAAVAESHIGSLPIEKVATSRKLNRSLLEKWAALVRLASGGQPVVTGHFTQKRTKVRGYDAVNGWGFDQTPNLLTNRSDQPVSFLTLTVPARGVTVHPSPTQDAVVSWQSPIEGRVKLEALVADTDGQCGNGVAWRLELIDRSGKTRIAAGVIDNGRQARFQDGKILRVERGDVVSLIVNARDRNHACDTTHVELKLSEVGGENRAWDLADDVVDRILEGNPLPDSYGNKQIWHFGSSGEEPASDVAIPPGSKLADWRAAVIAKKPADEIERLTERVGTLLTTDNPTRLPVADGKLRARLLDWKGPLDWVFASKGTQAEGDSDYGLDPARFGQHPNGSPLPEADLCLQAPQVLELRLPAQLVAGAEFVTGAKLHDDSAAGGSVQLQVTVEKPRQLKVSAARPILVGERGEARDRVEAALKEYRELFPPALCYARIVPVDEVVTLTLFYREDVHLKRLMLDERQAAELDRLWDELYFISQEPLQLVVALEQLIEFATQTSAEQAKIFAKLKQPVGNRAAAFRERQRKAEPLHLEAVLKLADRAWRRPLSDAERQSLRELYRQLRAAEVPHEEAIRLTLARVLTSPAFLYKLEQPAPGRKSEPVSPLELATRLSYFLWSSLPDAELQAAAESGRLTEEKPLLAQTRRMRDDPRTRRLAIHFACQWLHVRDFDRNDDKNEQLYPEFAALRGEMYEETVRFFEDLFRNDGSILGLLDADHTFLNESLARHYGIDGVSGNKWRRVDGVRAKGRGGVLGMATVLASQSGASRTSPILRGNWVYETLLGERLPRPPPGVPILPEQVPAGLTARQLIERHSRDEACARCHAKIDPYGFALEQYDAIGRLRPRPINTKTTLADGKTIEGIDGLRKYLAQDRRDDFVRQFCRKLLGYALGREVQLSDEPLLEATMDRLAKNDYRISAVLEAIVTSPQFRNIRGREYNDGQED